ncbi:MAG: hypothetical protein COY74_09375 [Nitrosopumilales archaeon CG_4_10_14_0_8_um_filter_34_8]|nr:MAG: hypothetical protein COY74_09375 [Nitrosopumilales archaeon CG_4_10_14_0_8_um_filter_34_8]PJB96290.1 MAG: hypothetical protein CO079_10265 [Nitrosopumilales archaeon CG_4_9_14_0_8_um_filter_34_10]
MITNNESVTNVCNTRRGLTKREGLFLEDATRINKQEQRPFSFRDFSGLSQGNFRQIILRLHDQIEVVYKSRPCFYKIKGMELPGDNHRITQRVMGDEVFHLLNKLKDQPPKIHDLKLKFFSDLHNLLIIHGCSIDPSNKSIKINVPSFDNNVIVKFLVYPKIVQVDIGCTFKPFVYDIPGVIDLTFVLGRAWGYIDTITNYEAKFPPVGEWIVTHYHFGKDGTEQYSGQMFHYSWDDVSSGLVRFYSKTMPNGRIIPRIEQIVTPKISLDQELDRIVMDAKC